MGEGTQNLRRRNNEHWGKSNELKYTGGTWEFDKCVMTYNYIEEISYNMLWQSRVNIELENKDLSEQIKEKSTLKRIQNTVHVSLVKLPYI